MPERQNLRSALESEASAAGAADDNTLIERVRRGENEVFAELVRKYQDRIHNTCWRLCGHLEDARDLTQEAFLKAFEALDRFRHQSGFYTWVFRIAVNLALTHRRTNKRRQMRSTDLAGVDGTQAEALARRARNRSDSDEGLGKESDAELLGRVSHALHELEEEHRAVLVLRDIEGFDYQQIADILEVPAGTVKSRLHRARLALRERLEVDE